MADLTVKVRKTINAPVEKVFNAWLNTKTLSKFMLHSGKYLEINQPNNLVFTWESPFSTKDSTVTILFTPIDDNHTEIDFTHVKFKDEQARADHEGGWSRILEKLSELTSATVVSA